MRLRPDLVLVKLAPPPQRNPKGLFLAHGLDPVVCFGKAVQIGAKVSDVVVGDVVIFPHTVGDPLDGMFPTPHLLIPESDISAVIERSA